MTDAVMNGANIVDGAAALVENARKLGLVWRLVPGTVNDITAGVLTTQVPVIMDGDTNSITAFDLVGVFPGMRVMVLAIPPSGNYIIGNYQGGPNPLAYNFNNDAVSDTTTSISFVDLAGGITISNFVKMRSDTAIEVDMRVSMTTTVANTRVGVAARIDGVDTQVTALTINPINTHTFVTGKENVLGISAGVYTIQGRWRRAAGTGTLTRNSDDWVTMAAREVLV
jgi:hypothetical protein